MCLDLMEFLYRMMEELSDAGVPIVFKGAMVLNLAIRGTCYYIAKLARTQ